VARLDLVGDVHAAGATRPVDDALQVRGRRREDAVAGEAAVDVRRGEANVPSREGVDGLVEVRGVPFRPAVVRGAVATAVAVGRRDTLDVARLSRSSGESAAIAVVMPW
jgi:hypothetical protein